MDAFVGKESTYDTVSTIAAAILRVETVGIAIDRHADLVTLGMTSVELVSLMLRIEDVFAMTIPQHELRPENFRSLDKLTALVESLQRPPIVESAGHTRPAAQ